MKIIVTALLALYFTVASWAAPIKPTVTSKSNHKIEIDAKARAVFVRATKIYGNLKGLSASWSGVIDEGATVKSSLDFDRAGRLRLANGNPFESLVVIDGKTRWSLEAPREKGKRPAYTQIEIAEDEAMVEMRLISPGFTNILGELLIKSNPLDVKNVEEIFEPFGLRAFRATTLPPQFLGSQLCDLVRITYLSSTFSGLERIEQRTYWFARSDGRLIRFQGKIMHGGKQKSVGDWRMISQTFNPKFAPNTFKFTPPQGAVLRK